MAVRITSTRTDLRYMTAEIVALTAGWTLTQGDLFARTIRKVRRMQDEGLSYDEISTELDVPAQELYEMNNSELAKLAV